MFFLVFRIHLLRSCAHIGADILPSRQRTATSLKNAVSGLACLECLRSRLVVVPAFFVGSSPTRRADARAKLPVGVSIAWAVVRQGSEGGLPAVHHCLALMTKVKRVREGSVGRIRTGGLTCSQ